MADLKPCPFCASTDIQVYPNFYGQYPKYAALCCGCQTEGPINLGESGAIEQWNTRPVEDELLAACESALEALNELIGADYDLSGEQSKIRAAIAKAKGGDRD